MFTGIEHTLDLPVTQQQVEHYARGALAQEAFPDLDPPLREFIMTGVTPQEWDEEFGGEDEE
jgi:hypothetical protein